MKDLQNALESEPKADTEEYISIPKDVLICLARTSVAFFECVKNHLPADFCLSCSTCELGNTKKCDTNIIWDKVLHEIDKFVGTYPDMSGIDDTEMKDIHFKILDAVKAVIKTERERTTSIN